MPNSYTSLVKQTFHFPQEGFEVNKDYLEFNGVDLQALIEKHGTPLKLTYLPKIGMQINKAKLMFKPRLQWFIFYSQFVLDDPSFNMLCVCLRV